MKNFFVFLCLIFSVQTRSDVFENWQRDPDYQKVHKLCVVGDTVASLTKLQEEFARDDLKGLKTGLLSSIGKGSPIQVDPEVTQQWKSTPFYLGLIDCFGNTKEGLFLTEAFMTELILGYSTSQSVGWAVPQLVGLRLFSSLLDISVAGLKNFAVEIDWILELMESHPELLPRVQIIFQWAGRLGILAYGISKESESYLKAKSDALANSMIQADPSSYEPPGEQNFEIEHEKDLIQNLEKKRKTCRSPESCREIKSVIAELEKNVGSQI